MDIIKTFKYNFKRHLFKLNELRILQNLNQTILQNKSTFILELNKPYKVK